MVDQSYFQLIAPLIFLVFGFGFSLIYILDRHSTAALYCALSYACGACGTIVDFLRPLMNLIVSGMIANVFYLLTLCFFLAAVARRYREPLPGRRITAIATLWINSWFAFTFLIPDLNMRAVTINAFSSLLLFLAAALMWRHARRAIDRVLLVATLLSGALFFFRTPVALVLTGEVLSNISYEMSATAFIVHFSNAMTALVIATTMFVMFGMDIVSNLREQSQTDPLSGLLNRFGFDIGAQAMIERLKRTPLPASLIVGDIDHFKKINDTHGHAVGDAVIVKFGQIVQGSIRKTDIAGRVGGEEFCILLWNCDLQGARVFAEGLRTTIEAQCHASLSTEGLVTASFGVATWHEGEDYCDLFERADTALYDAKRGGRNRVQLQSVADCPSMSTEAESHRIPRQAALS